MHFKAYCDEENLECTVVADVTDTNRLIMNWNGETIVDISRDFLNTNGASQQQEAIVTAPADRSYFLRGSSSADNFKEKWLAAVSDLNTASQQGLAERFDSTVVLILCSCHLVANSRKHRLKAWSQNYRF